MNIEEYVKNEKKLLEEFTKYWDENNKKNPEVYFSQLPQEEWDEQFSIFVEYIARDDVNE